MSASYPFRRRGGTLVPASAEAEEALRAMKDGRDCMVTLKVARNVRHHKLLFAALRFVQENTDLFEGRTTDVILTALKIATGHVDVFTDTSTGATIMVPKSIAFESLDQTAFSRFFDAAVNIITSRWMPPGTVTEDVRRHIEDMVDGGYSEMRRA